MTKDIEKMMVEEGIDIFGTSDATGVVPEKFTHIPFAITIGVRMSDAVLDEVGSCGPTKNYFHHYRTANAFLDRNAFKCVIALQRKGHLAVAIPASQTTNTAGIAADFSHKIAANLAGLGFIGKSGMFITKDYGPRVRFATILTDLPLKSAGVMAQQCGQCSACVKACPCGAILGNAWTNGMRRDDIVDAALCSRYMKDKYKMIGRGSVCGICVAVCPFGTKRASAKNIY